jgi:3-hydroxyisobutyrate dehydrogenase-like beta-hydroxyacid dehydrogenase
MAASHKSESTVYLGALASLLYERLRTQGYGTKDFSSVFQFLQETDTTWLDSGKTTGESK